MTSTGGAMSALRRAPRVIVVLDTNVLHGAGSEDLFSAATVAIITALGTHDWVKPEWVLPDTVWHERLHQLYKLAEGCVPTLEKISRLTGKAPLVAVETVRDDIAARAEEQRMALGMTTRVLDCARLDLGRLRMDALYRRAPFSEGEREKGFRDALIVETLFQLIEEIAAGIADARVFMVSADQGLAEAVTARGPHEHVRVVRDLEALRGALTAIEEAQDEALVARIQGSARNLFFTKGDQSSLYIREGVSKRIQKTFAKALQARPKGADRRVNGTWRISEPEFIKKEGRRISWKNTMTVACEALATRLTPAPPTPNLLQWPGVGTVASQGQSIFGLPGLAQSGYLGATGFGTPQSGYPLSFPSDYSGGTLWLSGQGSQEFLTAKGETRFEIAWDAECTADEVLSRACTGFCVSA